MPHLKMHRHSILESFVKDEMTYDAVLRNLEIIDEAAKKIHQIFATAIHR